MNALTNRITERPWADTLTTWHVLMDGAYQPLITKRGRPFGPSSPQLKSSDSEGVTVALIVKNLSQAHKDAGYAFVSQYLSDMFSDLIKLNRFKVRRCELIAAIEVVR